MIKETNNPNDFLSSFEEETSNDNILKDGVNDTIDMISTPPIFEEESEDHNPESEETQHLEEEHQEDIKEESEEEHQNTTEDDSNEDTEEFNYKAFLSHLNNEGVVRFEDSDDIENSVDVVYESVKNTIKQGIDSYKESIPEDGRKFLEYLEKGGDVNRYLETLQKPIDLNSLDLENEDHQELVVREFLKLQDYSNEEIEETIEGYKEGLLLEKQAKLASKKVSKAFDERTERLLQEQEAIQEQRRVQYEQYVSNIDTTIEKADSLAGLEVNKFEKDSFKKYLLERGKDGLTTYERELQEDPIKVQLELAYLKFKKYDFAKAKKAGETEANKKISWKIKSTDGPIKTGKTTVDLSTKEDPLEAFRKSWGKK